MAVCAAPTFCNDSTGLARAGAERKAWVAKLKEGRAAEAEEFFGGMQRGYEMGAKTDAELHEAFLVFDQATPSLTPFLEDWSAKHPQSYAARLAYAYHLFAIAWEKRGRKYAAETSRTQMEGMKLELERMVDVLNRADPKTPRPIVSHVLRLYLARTLVGPREVADVLERAERLDPKNSIVKGAFIRASTPKWGGDLDAIRRLVRDVLASSSASPDLKNYVRYEAEMAFADSEKIENSKDHAIEAYERAAKLCPAFAKPYENLLQLYRDSDNPQGTVTAAQRYLEINPTSGWAHAKLGAAQARLGKPQESFQSYERASQLGDRTGTEGLAWHYARGTAVPRNPAKALELYQMVHDRGGTHVAPQVERLRQELRR